MIAYSIRLNNPSTERVNPNSICTGGGTCATRHFMTYMFYYLFICLMFCHCVLYILWMLVSH